MKRARRVWVVAPPQKRKLKKNSENRPQLICQNPKRLKTDSSEASLEGLGGVPPEKERSNE